jgi:dolichyl-phosphate-mannose-protein mannosyltransferase
MHLGLGIFGIWILAIATRLWQLDQINQLVFDEIYYPKFAQSYLLGQTIFDAHPPLGKYLIGLGIQLFGFNPFGYRIVNAIAGSLIPVLVSAFTYHLAEDSFRKPWALWAGLFTALDGLLLVESRFGLINIYLVLFGMLSQLCLLLAYRTAQTSAKWMWVIASGIMLGAACSIKWSGLLYAIASICLILLYGRPAKNRQLSIRQILCVLILLPCCIYLLAWIPHLLVNPATNFGQVHEQIWGFHQRLGKEELIAIKPPHAYCSKWWTWIWMIRPIAYYFKEFPNGMRTYVTAMGNPFLYWFSGLTMLGLIGSGCEHFWRKQIQKPQNFPKDLENPEERILFYLAIAYLGNYLPWILSWRCTFLYHYLPASVFAFMAIAWLTVWCNFQPQFSLRLLGKVIPGLIILGFLFWMPIYLGLPITASHFYRIMLPSWI